MNIQFVGGIADGLWFDVGNPPPTIYHWWNPTTHKMEYYELHRDANGSLYYKYLYSADE